MKASTKRLLNFAFIFATLAVVLYIGFSGNELSGAWQALSSISPLWLLACFMCWVIYILLDALSSFVFLRKQGYQIGFFYMIYISIIGIYYCNITPGASGGQPMQIYYLNKRDIPIGIGTSALTVKFFCFQLMLMVLGTIAWLTYRDYVYAQIGASNMWILTIGYIYNMISVTFVLLMAVSRRLVRFFIVIFIKVGSFFRICKDPDASLKRWEGNLHTFHASVMMLRRNPLQLLLQMGIAAVQVLVWMCVTVAVYFAFGLSGTGVSQLITIGLLLYISASYTPLPGASGAQEGGFAIYFRNIFPDSTLFVALLIWRFFTFYLSLIMGAIISVISGFIQKKEGK